MAHIRKHPVTGKAQVRYRDPSGKERSKTFVRSSDARAYKSQIEHEMTRGAYIDRSLSKTAFCEVAAMWLAGKVGLRRSSWVRDESYLRRHVVSFFGSYEVGSITKLMIEQWVRGLCSLGLSAGTVRQCFRILRCVLDDAVERGLIFSSPCRRIGLPRVVGASPLFLGPSSVARLASCIEPRFSALVLTAAYLGLRWGELAGLLVSSLSLSSLGSSGFSGAAGERSEPLNGGATSGRGAVGSGARGEPGGSGGFGDVDGSRVGAGRSRSERLDGGAPAGRGAIGSSGPSGSEPPSRNGEAARTGAGVIGEPVGSWGFGDVDGSREGAGRSRSERLDGGAPAGSDSFGAGGSPLLRVVRTLEEVAGIVRYVSETKSRGGRRSLTIPPFLSSVLAAHLSSFGVPPSLVPFCVDAPSVPGGSLPSSSFVFTDVDGSVLRGSRFRRRYWKPAVLAAGLDPSLRFHDLRHTCASLLIAQGAHPKEIQARLGHASIKTTLDTYGHLLPNLGARLDEGLERMWREAGAGSRGCHT